MTNKFIRASMVILAESHNPSILSPDWLKRNEVITEKPNQFVLTPDFAVFDSKSFNLVVDRQRLQLNAKKATPTSLKALIDITTKYLELLPHIPYLRLGLNFEWVVEEDEKKSPPDICLTIGSTKDFTPIFPDHELFYGSIIYAQKESYRLRLNIEPTDENALIYKFNFDFNIKDKAVEKIKEFVTDYIELYKFSSQIVNKTVAIKGEEEK
ncbi:MAG: hypothetical protein HZR80_14770 [Candidatus Heimdallarchaeota archaeon]